MKKTKQLLIIGLLMFPLCLLRVSAQNVYIEVLDVDTYRPLPDVRVDMESSTTRITFYTSPAGSINENVPAGEYTVTLTHYGYETLVEHGVMIRTYERNLYTFRLKSRSVEATDPQDEQTAEVRDAVSLQPPVHKLFAGLGYQFGNIKAIRANIGYYVMDGIHLNVLYAHSKQPYNSQFFADPSKNYEVVFHNLLLGLGYDYLMPLSNEAGIYGGPYVAAGVEVADSRDLVSHPDISYMFSPTLRPGFQIGMYYEGFAFHLGVEYTAWVLDVMNQDRKVIERGTDGQSLDWVEDLFKERKGLGISAGIRYFF